MDFRERYKRVGFGREDIEMNRALRSQRRDELRRKMRSEHFNMRRCMENNSDDSFECEERGNEYTKKTIPVNAEEEARNKAAADLEAAVQKRTLQLRKWCEERNRRRLQEKKRAKPVFKVGVVHHRVYSPPLTKNPIPLPVPKLCKSKEAQPENIPKRVTRATEKRLAIKAVTNQQKRENLRSKKTKKNELHTISVIPKDHQFKAPVGVTPLPIFGRQAIEESINKNEELDLIYINPSSVNSKSKNSKISPTESFITYTTDSLILPTLSKTQSNLSEFNANSCDTMISDSLNDSLNNSSVESVSLKMSSDDQELLNEEENVYTDVKVNCNNSENSRVTRSSRSKMQSSKIFDSDVLLTAEEKDYSQNNNDSNLSIKNRTMSKKRSNKIIRNGSVDFNKSTKNINFTAENQKAVNSQENLNSDDNDNNDSLNSSFSKKKTTKALRSKTRSNTISKNETVNFKNIAKENSFLGNEKILDNDLNLNENASTMDSTTIKRNNARLSRRSTRTPFNGSPSVKNVIKESNFTLRNQEVQENDENISLNWVNLMDQSIVNQNKINCFGERKKSARISNKIQRDVSEWQEESLIKFSPRNSIRPVEKSPKQLNVSVSTKVKENPKLLNLIEESLLCPESANMFSTSELTKRETPEDVDNSKNFSLNLSVDNCTPEKPPAFFSPYIVTSRGKSSSRKEVKHRRFSQNSPKEIPTKDTIMQSLNISVKEEEGTAQYYKHILSQEIDRLNERCDIWKQIMDNNLTPEDIRYEIQAAVGQTKLLINKKFQRFHSLVLDCETGKGEMLVTCKDLQGFWDMMYMEIKDCDNRFNKLEELKQNEWIIKEAEEVNNIQKLKKKKLGETKKPVDKKNTVTTKLSSLRAHIMAARKKIENKDTNVDVEMSSSPNKNQKISPRTDKQLRNSNSKDPVKNVRRISTPKSSNKWQPVLKNLCLNQKTTSPLIMMKLSQMCKTPEVHLDDSIVYVNSSRTPAKSILKTAKDDLIACTGGKSANKVFFKEQPMEFQEIESKNQSIDSDNSYSDKDPIERKLDFESDSFNSSCIKQNDSIMSSMSPGANNSERTTTEYPKILSDKESSESPTAPFSTTVNNNVPAKYLTIPKIMVNDKSPMISVSPLTIMDNKTEDSSKKVTKTKKKISFKEDINEIYLRTLRNRKFSVPLTPRLNLKNSMKKVDEDLTMDVDDSIQEYKDDSPFPVRQESQLQEFFLNADGIICQRIVAEKLDVPNPLKLKQSNSQTSSIDLNNLVVTPVVKIANVNKKSSSTRTIRRQNSKKSLANTELREDNANITVEEITKEKLNRTKNTPNKTKNNIDEIENINESSKKGLRINSTPVNIKSNFNNNSKQSLDSNSKFRNSKRLQENVEPAPQETNQNMHESVKMLRTSSLKRNSTKKFTQSFEQNEQQTSVHRTTNEALTPNRRKSLRIAQVNRSEV